MKKILSIIFVFSFIYSCNLMENHTYDGAYSMNISVNAININSEADLIINGNKLNYKGDIIDCIQNNDNIQVNGKILFNIVDGDLIVNLPPLGKVRYVKISNNNDLNSL